MSWNHRILVTEDNNGDIYFQIHEVFYNGDGTPNGYTMNPITIGSDDIKGLTWTVNKIKECLKKPILWGDNKFPQEYLKT